VDDAATIKHLKPDWAERFISMRKRWIPYPVLVVTLATVASAYADNWSIFRPIGNNVSVSFTPADSTTYTWKFRNDGYNRITYMEFRYSYINANTGLPETETDVLPGSLGPGEVIGGWAAFTAESRSEPLITITNIQRQ
jgi:hypothetical protein